MLDVSHDCWHGAYSAFNRFRQAVARACGGSFPPHDPGFRHEGEPPAPMHWYYDEHVVPTELMAGMKFFLGHSDCDGELDLIEAAEVAKFLRWVAPRFPADVQTGHMSGMRLAQVAERFAAGCEDAVAAGESVEFA